MKASGNDADVTNRSVHRERTSDFRDISPKADYPLSASKLTSVAGSPLFYSAEPGGRIVDQGGYDALLARNPAFQKFVSAAPDGAPES